MSIEIRELNIRINVEGGEQSESPDNAENNENNQLIAACVEQVMEIISKKQER